MPTGDANFRKASIIIQIKYSLKVQTELYTRTYRAVINLEPLVLDISNITYVVTREGSIHDIQVNNHSIEPVNWGLITCSTHVRSQVQNFWESNRFIDLPEFTWLRYTRKVEQPIRKMVARRRVKKYKVSSSISGITWNRFNAIVRTFGASNTVNFFLARS